MATSESVYDKKSGAGRSHTVVVTEDGLSFAFGLNKHGQLGSGSAKNGLGATLGEYVLLAVRYDLSRLMIGVLDWSEGTLGVITEVKLRLEKIPQHSVIVSKQQIEFIKAQVWYSESKELEEKRKKKQVQFQPIRNRKCSESLSPTFYGGFFK